jgi:hypothetical protein
MLCTKCGTNMIQTGGWFLGGATFECPKCDPHKTSQGERVLNDRYVRIAPIGGVANGVIKDCQTGKLWSEKNFVGVYSSISSMIHQLNNLNYNNCSTWRLPYIMELLDLINLGTPVSSFPGIKAGIYFAQHIGLASHVNVPIVDFAVGNTYNVGSKTPGNFKLIQ